MSKALIAGIAILSLITGMAGGLGTGYLIYHSQVSNLQGSQGFNSLEINATYYKDYSAVDLTFKNPTETPIYFEIESLIYRYFSNETGEWIWHLVPEPSNCLILPNEKESLYISYVPHIEEADKIFILGNNFYRRITLTPYQPSEPETPQSGAVLSLENVNFYAAGSTNNRAAITIMNTGTADANVYSIYWSKSSLLDLDRLISSEYDLDPETGVVGAGSSLTITIKWGVAGGTITDSEWVSGTTYYFKVVTDTGQQLPFAAEAPTTTEQLEFQGCTFSGTSGATNNTIVLTVQNTGTADLSVAKYKLGVSGTQYDVKDSPVSVLQGATVTITCETGADSQPWTSGTTYDIYLITSTGSQFRYRATAP